MPPVNRFAPTHPANRSRNARRAAPAARCEAPAPRRRGNRRAPLALLTLALLAAVSLAGPRVGASHRAADAPRAASAPTRVAPRKTAVKARDKAPARVWPAERLNPTASARRAWRLADGARGRHEILFTFDDGPNPGTTDEVLAILAQARIRAAFFVVGERLEGAGPNAERSRALLREIAARGHAIGNHSMSHPRLGHMSAARIAYQIDHTDELIEQVTGTRPYLFRPPYGDYTNAVRRHVRASGHELWLWSVDPQDWALAGDADETARRVIAGIAQGEGGTVLLHDIHAWTPAALRQVLAWIARENAARSARGEPEYKIVDAPRYLADQAGR